METCNLDDIMRAIGNLEGTAKTGFEAINQRLDTVNGRLGKHDDQIREIQLEDSKEAGERGAISWVGSLVWGGVALVAGIVGSFIQAGKNPFS